MKFGLASLPWRIVLVLWLAVAVVTPMAWPYTERLLAIAPHAPQLQGNVGMLLFIRNLVAAAILIPVGLFCARRVGLTTPYLDYWFYRRGTPEPVTRLLTRSVAWAVGLAVCIITIDLIFYTLFGETHPAPEVHARIPGVEAWRGFSISFYAGVIAELQHRLFAMSVLAWVLISVTRTRGSRGRTIWLWMANLGAALYYVTGYIPGVEWFGPVSDLVLIRTYLIVLPAGLVFGYLYQKNGLESAIACHFFADIVIHVIRPLVDPGAW